MEKIRAAKLQPNVILPTRKHPDDAGIDFYASEEKTISPHAFDVVGTGITIEIPQGYVGLMMPKSRNNHLLGAGVIDAGYQGRSASRSPTSRMTRCISSRDRPSVRC